MAPFLPFLHPHTMQCFCLCCWNSLSDISPSCSDCIPILKVYTMTSTFVCLRFLMDYFTKLHLRMDFFQYQHKQVANRKQLGNYSSII
jgi:hypothetical protein